MENNRDKKTDELVQRYVDILTNGGIKALFGDIEYMPTEYQGPVVSKHKEYQYDFMCRDINGAVFIVELQKYKEEYWFKRGVHIPRKRLPRLVR